MTAQDAFLQAIHANPDDDAPRLMYADWLTERGDVRGEFIRLQCELARLPEHDVRRGEWLQRANHLLQRYGQGWREALPRLDGVTWTGFERGFVARVTTASVRAYLRHAEAIFAAVPTPEVRFPVFTSDTLRELAASPQSGHLRTLEVHSPFIGPDDVRILAESPHWTHLRSLSLSSPRIGHEAAAAFAASLLWQKLERLDLARCNLGDTAVIALVETQRHSTLVELNLAYNRLSGIGATALAEAAPSGLQRLNLDFNAVDALGAEALLTSARLRCLVDLTLACNRIGDLRVDRLAAAESAALRRLSLRRNHLGDRAARALAECPRLDGLVELDLQSNEIGDVGAAALAGSSFLAGLQRLILGSNRIGDRGVDALLASRLGRDAEVLVLGGNRHGSRLQTAVQRRRTRERLIVSEYS